jgi:hypothetical protein
LKHTTQILVANSKAYLRLLLYCCLTLSVSHPVISQTKRMVALGSSTTLGAGATSADSCWVSLFKKYYQCRMGVADTVYNMAVAGTSFYSAMPNGSTAPPLRPAPDPLHNVSSAVVKLAVLNNPADGVVIVNFPTNGYNTYSIAEIMSGLQTIYDSVLHAGNRCFITTTQPRTDGSFGTSANKKKLADIKDSIIHRFGVANSINFWDGLFNPADTTILPEYAYGDNIHFNNAGHRLLFERVLEKNVFGFPVWYSKSTGALNEVSSWGCNADGSGVCPADFSADHQTFYIVNNQFPAITNNWILNGKNVRIVIGNGLAPVDLIIPQGVQVVITNTQQSVCH